MHSVEFPAGTYPDIKKTFTQKYAQLLSDCYEPEYIEKLLRVINDIPDRNTFLHGDFHTKNIMLQSGEPILIDMDTVSLGHPILDIASPMSEFDSCGLLPEQREKIFGIKNLPLGRVREKFIEAYFGECTEELHNTLLYRSLFRTFSALRTPMLNADMKKHAAQVFRQEVEPAIDAGLYKLTF